MRAVDSRATPAILALAVAGTMALGGCASTESDATLDGADADSASGASEPRDAGTSPNEAGAEPVSRDADARPRAAPNTAVDGADDGRLFEDAAIVAASPPSSPDAARPGTISPTATGTLRISGLDLSAVFTQKDTDVTMVLTATNCPQGSYVLRIHAGFACDNAGTQGGVWDGKRGDGIPMLVCGADKKASLTYTRSGADAETNWTVGDHNTKTDVTLHPALVAGKCGTFF